MKTELFSRKLWQIIHFFLAATYHWSPLYTKTLSLNELRTRIIYLHLTSICTRFGWESPALFRAWHVYKPECWRIAGLNCNNSCKLAGWVWPSLRHTTEALGFASTTHRIAMESFRSSTSSVGRPTRRVSGTTETNTNFQPKNRRFSSLLQLIPITKPYFSAKMVARNVGNLQR